MKKNTTLRNGIIALVVSCMVFSACKEDIDTSNRYTFLGETVGSFLEKNAETYSDFNYILIRSGMMSLLKAYGSYTCFAPTNEAVERYLFQQDSIYKASLRPGSPKVVWTGITSPVLEDLTDSMCTVISNTHILAQAFLTTEMEGDVVPAMNLNDRFLTMSFGVDENLHSIMYINGARLTVYDQEQENGVIHTVADVLNPSTNTVPTQIADMPFLSIFSDALARTRLEDDLQLYRDDSYTDADKIARNADMSNNPVPYPPSRYYGYTAFCETDSVFHANGIWNIDDLYAKCKLWYPDPNENPDFTSEHNALWKFMAYHLLDWHLLYTRLVFYNLSGRANGVSFKSENHFSKYSDRFEYYETKLGTMVKIMIPRSTDISGVTSDGKMREYRNTIFLNYSKEISRNSVPSNPWNVTVPSKSTGQQIPVNVRIMDPSEVLADTVHYPRFLQEALNGSIHLLDNLLIYDDDVMAGYVLNNIIRIDWSAVVPELTNNHLRWYDGTAGYQFAGGGSGFFIPDGYSKHVRIYSDECKLSYFMPNDGWDEYEGDLLTCRGQYDFAYRLPRVPPGTYEIRVSSINEPERGVVQYYIDGEVTGIPKDNRIYADNPRIGYIKDNLTDDNGVANDKEMKNRGYLKLPISYWSVRESGAARKYDHGVRIVLTTKYLSGDTHWLRMKNVNDNPTANEYLNHDYFELVPVSWLRREDISLEEKRQ
ncbi:MAG: fasciclin domain-containing protein [Bacteroidaceae bacterium]|nr:fasciclin domain-containing protein [Bacteroidaceae bacterium]